MERIAVTNVLLAADKLQQMLDAKRDRGMRLRYAYDLKERWVEISGRCSEPVRVSHRFLSDSGVIRRAN